MALDLAESRDNVSAGTLLYVLYRSLAIAVPSVVVISRVLSSAGFSGASAWVVSCVSAAALVLLTSFEFDCLAFARVSIVACSVVAFVVLPSISNQWSLIAAILFAEALLYFVLRRCGVGSKIARALPDTLWNALLIGLGASVAVELIGKLGIVVPSDSLVVGLGLLTAPSVVVALISIAAVVSLKALSVPHAYLIAIIIAAFSGVPLGVTQLGSAVASLPDFSQLGMTFESIYATAPSFFMSLVSPMTLSWLFLMSLIDFRCMESLTIKSNTCFGAGERALGLLTGIPMVRDGSVDAKKASQFSKYLSIIVFCVLLFLTIFSPLLALIGLSAVAGPVLSEAFRLIKRVVSIGFDDLESVVPSAILVLFLVLTRNVIGALCLGLISHCLIYGLSGRVKSVTTPTFLLTVVSTLLATACLF